MAKKSIELKGTMDIGRVISHLEEIVNGLKEGTICIQQGTDIVSLKPNSNIEIELEASLKSDKEKLSIELSWRQEPEIQAPDRDFKIMSAEPEGIEETVSTELGEG